MATTYRRKCPFCGEKGVPTRVRGSVDPTHISCESCGLPVPFEARPRIAGEMPPCAVCKQPYGWCTGGGGGGNHTYTRSR